MSLEDELRTKAQRVMNRLAKWRSVFAGWQLGTRLDTDGECIALKEHREATILLRVELNALTRLLITKGVIKEAEFYTILMEEAERLHRLYEKLFDGYEATSDGMVVDVRRAVDTHAKLHFRP